MPLCNWSEEDWSALVYAIRQQKCILMLGPETAVGNVENEKINEPPRRLSELLAEQLAEELKPDIRDVIDTASLTETAQYYTLQPSRGRIDLELKIRDFFNRRRHQTTRFHDNLAALPFRLAITSSPDHMFHSALEKHKKQPQTAWYNFKRKRSNMTAAGSVEQPLLFYLYGSVNEPESLVLTENDLLDFLVSIVSKESLPDRLLNELQAPDISFLFLGFGFKHWYLRILLHVLEVKQKINRSFALEDFAPRSLEEFESTVFFYREGPCKIHFFEKGFDDFAAGLRRRYEAGDGGAAPPREVPADRPKVFICHASEDKAKAADLYVKLEAAGFAPWLDKENLRGGDRWDDAIKKAVKKDIDYFLVLQSRALENKTEGYVNKEIFLARERQTQFRYGTRFIIPLKIEECRLLEELEDLHTVDMTGDNCVDELNSIIKRDYTKRKGGRK